MEPGRLQTPDAAGTVRPKCCCDCKWWHKLPATAEGLAAVAKGQAPQGSCRGNPPGFCPVAMQPNGQLLVMIKYPDPRGDCPACRLFELRVQVLT